MRIISGKYKGRIVKVPKGIRPTQEKVRKALFDILGDVEGCVFLELFAGSGAVGLEAVSLGVEVAVFAEKEYNNVKIIENNLSLLDCRNSIVLPLDAFKAIERLNSQNKKFDLIFLDPPYSQDLAKKTLQKLADCDIVTPHGLIIAQHFKKDNLPDALGDLVVFRQAKYGDTILSFYQKTIVDS